MTAHFLRIEAQAPPVATRMIDSLDMLASDAAGMLGRPFQRSPYDRFEWLTLTARHLWPDMPIAVAAIRQGPHSLWLPLRDIGRGRASSFARWYTLVFAPILTPGCPAEVRSALLDTLVRQVGSRFGAVGLWPLEPDIAAELQSAFRAAGWIAITRVETAHWVAHTTGLDFDAYWARRGSKLRNTVRRRAKASPVETRIFNHFDADAWVAYEAVYAGSWKPNEGSPAFVRAFAEQEGAAGTLRLGIALRDGRPVAAQFWTVEHGVATIHKLAHLESERANSPGTLLSHAMFRHVLDHDRPDLIDYGNGDEGYKAEWMDERRVRLRLRLFNPYSLSGLIAGATTAAKALARRLVR